MPRCNTEAMNLHLAEIAAQIAPGAHAALLVDQAGWHLSGRLVMPPNITLSRCRGKVRSSIRRKTSGSSCATTGSQTESSNPTTTSSTIAARLGTTSSINPGGSCPSAFAIGPMGPDQRVLVLGSLFCNSENCADTRRGYARRRRRVRPAFASNQPRHCERSEAIQGNGGGLATPGSPRRFAPRDDDSVLAQQALVRRHKLLG